MKLLTPLLGAFLLGALALPARSQGTPAANNAPANVSRDAAALERWRLVLDQLAQGDAHAARVLAEDGAQQYGDYPALSLLLAYLLQRDGHNAEATAALASAKPASALAREYSRQLSAKPLPAPAIPAALPSEDELGKAAAATSISLPQSDARLAKFEQAMAQMVNDERRKAGLEPLVTDSRLADIARAHSAEMRDKDYFSHDSPTDSLRAPMDRYRAVVQTAPRVIAENIYRVYSYGAARRAISEEDVRAGHEALMKSPGHRRNILEPRVTRLGIGIVTNAKGDMWITQMFLKP